MRIDLTDGKTLYYGFLTLTQADQSPAVPASHPGVDRWLILGIQLTFRSISYIHLEAKPDFILSGALIFDLIALSHRLTEGNTAREGAQQYLRKALAYGPLLINPLMVKKKLRRIQ
jgi:hypothetical protein